ncbi:MAG: hypothetical protein AAF664_12365 [Planctomycetota bacterium]
MESSTTTSDIDKCSTWLTEYSRDTYSQFGEDGVIEKALELIGETDGWCVEFGAWDGLHLSNTANLIKNKGYKGVLIEADSQRVQELNSNYSKASDVHILSGFVGWTEKDGLDVLLKPTPIPKDFDFLSVDIDGNDFHVWNAVDHYRPKLVLIEFNPTIPTDVDFVQPSDPAISHGASGLALTKLGARKGYDLVHVSRTNLLFVDHKYFDRFGIRSASFRDMRIDDTDVTWIFTGYDGTILLSGKRKMHFHGIPIRQKKMQVLPKYLRSFPTNYSSLQKAARKIFRIVAGRSIDQTHLKSSDFLESREA